MLETDVVERRVVWRAKVERALQKLAAQRK
jgi:hypothetical protein